MRVSLPLMRAGIALAAILLWANVQAFAFRVQTISVPITITNLSPGLAVSTPLGLIQVQLSGRSFYLNRVTDQNLKLAIDLSSVSVGNQATVPIKLSQTPDQVHVLSWEPKEINLTVDTATTASLPVVLDTSGYLADGFALNDLVADPATVSVTGSPALLSKITQVIGTVNLSHKRKNFAVPVELKADLGTTVTNLQLNPSIVTARGTVSPGSANRNLGIKPSFTGSLPAGYFIREVRFNPPTMMVTGNQRILSSLPNLISTPINLSDQRKTYTSDVAINLPTGIKTVGENLLKAEVVVELAQSSREFTVTPQFTNVTEGFGVAAVTPRAIKLVVLGDEATVRKLTKDQIALNVDLQGILSGSNTIPVTEGMFSLPPGVSVGSFTPESLEVILAKINP